MAPDIALEAIGVCKRFGPLQALDDVSLKLRSGRLHALLGENGAGKSTLVKCLMGYYQADAGQFLVHGREHRSLTPRDAHRAGIGMVYQHFTLVPGMTVAENLMLARSGHSISHRLAPLPSRVAAADGDDAVPHSAAGPRRRSVGRREAEGGDSQATLPRPPGC